MRTSSFVRVSVSLFVAVIAVGAVGCGGAPRARDAAPKPSVAVPAGATTGAPAPADDPNAGLVALVCARREKPCALVTEHDAGVDAQGRKVSAALFLVGYPAPEGDDAEADPASAAAASDAPPDDGATAESEAPAPVDRGLAVGADGATFSMTDQGSCFAYEYWRVVRDGAILAESDRIASICNDGNGAAGLGEDAVTVRPGVFEISRSGGSSWRWSETTTYSLSPFERLAETSDQVELSESSSQESRIDWRTFSGGTTWTTPQCWRSEDAGATEPKMLEHAYIWLPSLPLESAFLAGGWKTTAIAGCAASIESSGKRGHLVSGKAATGEGARVMLLASKSGEVFVEVRDPVIVGPSARPATDDHLEVWTTKEEATDERSCVDTESTAALSWNVRIADGKVTAGFGKPAIADLSVERAAGADGAVRFRLARAAGLAQLTITYADSDADGKIARRIATSQLADGRRWTLGSLSTAEHRVRCAVRGGVLVREMVPEETSAP